MLLLDDQNNLIFVAKDGRAEEIIKFGDEAVESLRGQQNQIIYKHSS